MAFYGRLLATHPIATKTATSAALFGLGDLMTQTQFERKPQVDLPRLARMTAWGGMFGITETYAAFCLIVFIVGSAAGALAGGFFADRVRRHDRVAAIGLMVAAAFTVPIAMQAVSPALLPVVLALAGAAGGATNPSRDMIVRNATPPGATGKVFGFVYSGLDIGSFLAPPLFGYLMSVGVPAVIFWIAIGLYLANVVIVMSLRQSVTHKTAPAAAE